MEKSRATQGLALLRAVYQAQKAYHMANGEYATTFDELAVDIPWTGSSQWFSSSLATRSNDDWSLQLYSSTNGQIAVTLGRLRGKYKGGGFGFYLEDPTTRNLPVDKLACLERTNNGVIFEGTAGSYCNKLFNAALVTTMNPRVYLMP
ncbi:MAG: hypothetical protein MJ053_04080 [Elusimicrobiaceae bacterium]|nr:hypothetical protein [Elusimicrobiaceae bacterium]